MDFTAEKTTLLAEPSPAKVAEIVGDRIRVRWKATYWDACVYVPNIVDRPIGPAPGQSVTVIGIRGIKLVVLF